MSHHERRSMLDDKRYDYLNKNDIKQDEQLKILNETLGTISGDVREIMTRIGHMEERFNIYQEEIKEIRDTTKHNEKKFNELESTQNVVISRGKSLESEMYRIRDKYNEQIKELDDKIEGEIDRIEEKSQETEEKSDNSRRWLVTTIITVIVGFSSVAVTLISIFL